jgi:outer membrane protein OmpA-like peptidoglycan-associated protein
MYTRGIVLAGAFVSLFAMSSAFGAPEGFFIGVGAGQTTAKADAVVSATPGVGPFTHIDYDETADAYKGYAGINFTKWFGIEGGYVQLGDSDNTTLVTFPGALNQTAVQVEVTPNGWQGFGVLYLPLGNFDIFGKVGGIAANIDVKTTTSGLLQVTQHTKRSEGNGMMAYGAGADYNFGHWAIRAEYEAYDTDKLDDLYVVSGSLQYTFFREKETPAPVVAAPAPAPKAMAPPPPAKCPDGDKDGVCDAVDQCPTTPAGARVGPGGCDCDYNLALEFKFDSAELSASDKTKIDAIIPVLKNPKVAFIAGEVDGYTDSTGDDKYNMDLSKRRAQSVADYVKSQGVSLGDRFGVNGYGESYPVASNDTAEGRAQNRRVVLRRTDCGAAH